MSSSDRSLKLIASQARPSLFRMNNAPIQPGTGAVGWVTQGATPTGNNLPIRWKCAALAAHSFVQAHLRFGHNRSTLGWTNRPPERRPLWCAMGWRLSTVQVPLRAAQRKWRLQRPRQWHNPGEWSLGDGRERDPWDRPPAPRY